ncbi:MAG TPA: AAA domain-containing protein [Solirubrobacteraceae bacterium]|jgi:hypothetical protein
MGERGESEERGDVLAFWRAVELFSPQQVPKPEEGRAEKAKDDPSLPWEKAHPLNEKPIEKTKAWQHSVYLGIYSLDDAYKELRAALGDRSDEDNGDRQEAGYSALAAFAVAEDGRVIPGSQTLSSCAWALGRAWGGPAMARGWLDGFERASREFANGLDNLLALARHERAGSDPEPEESSASSVLDLGLLKDIRDLVAETLEGGTSEDPEDREDSEDSRDSDDSKRSGRDPRRIEAIRMAVDIRVQSRQVRRTDDERTAQRDFLNSFIARDLEIVARAVGRGDCGPALRRYLTGHEEPAGERKACIDVERAPGFVRRALAPKYVPRGRWPRSVSEPADLGQQLALNAIINDEILGGEAGGEGGEGTLFGVNGPPGTGKTTMLRDLIAALVVERAQRLAELKKPSEAFRGKPIRFHHGGHPRTANPLMPGLTGFEMVLACATNAAAENVSIEIPLAQAIAPEWRDRIDYFGDVATNMLGGALRAGNATASGEAWAMVAARLGSVAHCQAFASAFWFHGPEGGSIDDEARESGRSDDGKRENGLTDATQGQGGLLHILRRHKVRPGDWERAVDKFRAALDRESAARAEREAYARLFDELEACRDSAEEHASQLKDARARLDEAEGDLARCRQALPRRLDEHKLAAQALARHRSVRPRVPEVLSSLGRIPREWRARDYELAARVTAAERALAGAHKEEADAVRAVADCSERASLHQSGERQARERTAQLERELADAGERWDTLFPGSVFPDEQWTEDSQRARRESQAPWLDESWDRARTEVFLAALELHKAFALATARRMQESLKVAIDVMQGSSPAEIPPEAALAAWQCLFMLVPVISTTFASYPRLFRHLGSEALGWLLVDEAGQSSPQNAAGPIWRARRAVVVGDPLQLEPIVALPLATQRHLQTAHEVPDAVLPGQSSVQTLADQATPVGTFRGSEGEIWVGSPLNVHRRCEQPMFGIVNQIAYDNQMIAHTPAREPLALPDSGWLHVAGEHSKEHWVPAEGVRTERLLDELASFGVDFSEVFLISPFRVVAEELRSYRKYRAGLTAGTIHTTQGQEADIVVLVLGGDPGRVTDKRWAAQRPNLLNVAVSRARRRLYVVGNRDIWSKQPYFQTLAQELPEW